MRVPIFSISPDPTCMYQTPVLRESVSKIRMAIEDRQGLCAVFGDVGFGKSSLLRSIASGYDANEDNQVALSPQRTHATPFEFLKQISKELDIPFQRSQIAQMDAIEMHLVSQFQSGKTVIIMIDEADRLRPESLECVRGLLNFETNTAKLVQFILAGQLEFRDRLMAKKYRAFRSRIVAPVVLEAFTVEETVAMIEFRHQHWNVPNLFSLEACQRIHVSTGGVPREIVRLCRECLVVSQAEDEGTPITLDHVEQAIRREATSSERETAEAAA